jgi:hypothetical protein
MDVADRSELPTLGLLAPSVRVVLWAAGLPAAQERNLGFERPRKRSEDRSRSDGLRIGQKTGCSHRIEMVCQAAVLPSIGNRPVGRLW